MLMNTTLKPPKRKDFQTKIQENYRLLFRTVQKHFAEEEGET